MYALCGPGIMLPFVVYVCALCLGGSVLPLPVYVRALGAGGIIVLSPSTGLGLGSPRAYVCCRTVGPVRAPFTGVGLGLLRADRCAECCRQTGLPHMCLSRWLRLGFTFAFVYATCRHSNYLCADVCA